MMFDNVTPNLWMIVMHSIYINGSVYYAHTKYEADCLDWQSIINADNELLCKADML